MPMSLLNQSCGARAVSYTHLFSDEVSELDGRLNFYMYCSFNPDEVFGTHVDSADNNNWLNIYAEYDLENSQVCDALKAVSYTHLDVYKRQDVR